MARAASRAAVFAREHREIVTEQAEATLNEEVRVAVLSWVYSARDWFPRDGKPWSLAFVRANNQPVRQGIERLATEIATLYMQVARMARRAAFAKALHTAADVHKHVYALTVNKQHALSKVREAGPLDEPRDALGRWTTGGLAASDSPGNPHGKPVAYEDHGSGATGWPSRFFSLPVDGAWRAQLLKTIPLSKFPKPPGGGGFVAAGYNTDGQVWQLGVLKKLFAEEMAIPVGKDEMIAFRVGRSPTHLAGRNVATPEGLLDFIERQEDRQMAYGDKISAYRIQLLKPLSSKYEYFTHPPPHREAGFTEDGFNPDEHPRHPPGSPQGGEFAAKGAGEEGGVAPESPMWGERIAELQRLAPIMGADPSQILPPFYKTQDEYTAALKAFIDEAQAAHGIPVTVDRDWHGGGGLTSTSLLSLELQARMQATIADLPPGVQRRLAEDQWVVMLAPLHYSFSVGGKMFDMAGQADYVKKAITVNESATEGTLAHELGHASVGVLAERLVQADLTANEWNPGKPNYGLSKLHSQSYPRPINDDDPVVKQIRTAQKYETKIGNAFRLFDAATIKEGGVTAYADSYVKDKERGWVTDKWSMNIDPIVHEYLRHAPPGGVEKFMAQDRSYVPTIAFSRAGNENFAEIYEQYARYKPSGRKSFFSILAKDKPDTAKQFRILVDELHKRRAKPEYPVIGGK